MKILMVCMGNICRSPMALAVARQLASDSGRSAEFEFGSAGTHAHHSGEEADPRAKAVLSSHHYKPSNSRARRVEKADFERFDLILAMDRANLASLRRACPAQYLDKLHLLLEFAPELELDSVPDPYFGHADGFERVLELCEAGVKGLLRSELVQTL
jgi:protein-tyrosine phosphatase